MATWLIDRATHVFFLRELAKEKVASKPGAAATPLGSLKTNQVVSEYVRPNTAKSKSNYVDCLCQGNLPPKQQLAWCPGGVLANVEGKPRAFGTTTYFLSHAWSYTFSGLIALADRHYCSLPETKGGKVFVPVYYWVDILAVTQHFTGDFKDHPDSDFESIIRASRAVLFTMFPWRSPIAPTRVWCLFEALTAVVSDGVELEVLLDTQDSRDTTVQTVMTIVSGVDVRAAQASVASDKAFIMGRIRDGVGVDTFNAQLRTRLKNALLAAAAAKAAGEKKSDEVVALAKAGWRGKDGDMDLSSALPVGAASHVTAVLGTFSAASGFPRRLVLTGRDVRWVPINETIMAAVGRMMQQGAGGSGGGVEELWLQLAHTVGNVKPFLGDSEMARWSAEYATLVAELCKEPGYKEKERAALARAKAKPYTPEGNKVMDALQREELRARHTAALAKSAAALPERLKLRSELWSGLAANSTLRTLVLHGCVLSAGQDVEELGRILRQHRTLRELLVVHVDADELRTADPADSSQLTRGLVGAVLGSRTLERVAIAPLNLALLEDIPVPGSAAWGGGGGDSLKEFILGPVALLSPAVEQLARLLAVMPQLSAGGVSVRRMKVLTSEPPSAVGMDHHHKDEETFKLAPVLEALQASGNSAAAARAEGASSPRVGVLAHFLGVGTCYAALAKVKGVGPDERLKRFLAKLQRDRPALWRVMQAGLEVAPPLYATGWEAMCPATRYFSDNWWKYDMRPKPEDDAGDDA